MDSNLSVEKWCFYQIMETDCKNIMADKFKKICVIQNKEELLYVLSEAEKESFSKLLDIHFFKRDILPMWEDPNNKDGGRIIADITNVSKEEIEILWKKTVAFCFYSKIKSITGCVLREKDYGYKLAIWFSNLDDNSDILDLWSMILDKDSIIYSYAPYKNQYDFKKKNHKKYSNRRFN